MARLNSIRILISIAVNMEWPLFQLDVKNVFRDLDDEVYIEQPLGYVAKRENIVYILRKAIYRLKQSPRAWFEKFSIIISGIDFALYHSNPLILFVIPSLL